jgi:hypothetical protein
MFEDLIDREDTQCEVFNFPESDVARQGVTRRQTSARIIRIAKVVPADARL